MDKSEDIVRLHRELAHSIHVADHDAVRRAYRELLRDGRLRQEVLDEVTRLATTSQDVSQHSSENAAPVEFSGSADKRKSNILDHENHSIERAIAYLPLPIGEPAIAVTRQTFSEPSTVQKDDAQVRPWAAPFSPLQRAVVCAFIGFAVLAAGSGGLMFFVHGTADKKSGVTVIIPAPPIQDASGSGQAGPAPAVGKTATATVSEGLTDNANATSLPASLPQGAGSSIRPIVVPAEEQPKELPPPAATATGGASLPATNSPANRATPDPALLARGDALFAIGDLSSARLFYEHAANAGDAQAALRLGETYDPAFLVQTQVRGARPDASAAEYWYLQADKLGAPEAASMLQAMANDLGLSVPAQRQASKP